MNFKNIKRLLSIALLIAFAPPSTLAYSELRQATSLPVTLSGNVRLTDSEDEITLSLRNSDVQQVLRMFADKAHMNIVFHDSVHGNVTLDLVKTPINEAFNLILQIAGLNYYKQGNTMVVMAKDATENALYSKQEMMVFPVNYVEAGKIAEFLNKNVFSMKKAGLSGSDAVTVNPTTNELIVFGMPSDADIVRKVIAQFDREPLSKTFSVNHTTPAEMANMICNVLLPSRGLDTDGSSTGGAASIEDSDSALKLGEGVVACSAYPKESDSEQALAAFNVQNISISYYPQRGTITMMGGSQAQIAMVEKFIKDNDIKQPQAFLEISIIELNEAGSKDIQNAWQISGRHWRAAFDGNTFGASRTHSTPWTSTTEYVWNGGANMLKENYRPGNVPDGTAYPIMDDEGNVTGMTLPEQVMRTVWSQIPSVHINWAMSYLIENRKARVLANPKILITNGQESVIDLTQDYVEKVTSEYLTSTATGSGATGVAQRNYSIANDLGIKVNLTPFISPDGYVTLNITPNYSTISEQIFATGATASSDLVATLLSRRNLDLKNVRIKDGETLVIGGMIQEHEQKSVHKIPFLGDLPLVGAAFRSTGTSKNKSELVIMITPKILQDGDDTNFADNL